MSVNFTTCSCLQIGSVWAMKWLPSFNSEDIFFVTCAAYAQPLSFTPKPKGNS